MSFNEKKHKSISAIVRNILVFGLVRAREYVNRLSVYKISFYLGSMSNFSRKLCISYQKRVSMKSGLGIGLWIAKNILKYPALRPRCVTEIRGPKVYNLCGICADELVLLKTAKDTDIHSVECELDSF